MTKPTSTDAEAVGTANSEYYERQVPLKFAFKSPFAMLNQTANDCERQRIEIGMSEVELERDKAIFNWAVDRLIAEHGYPDTNEKIDGYLAWAFEFVARGMRESTYPQNHWPLVACHAALVTLQGAQSKKTFKVDAVMTNVALFAQGMMNIAWKPQRMQEAERIARESLQLAKPLIEKAEANKKQIKKAQANQSKSRHDAALEARTLVTKTLFPEWRSANPDARLTEGHRHCAKVLTGRGYKTANGTQITCVTVKGYLKTKRTSEKTPSSV